MPADLGTTQSVQMGGASLNRAKGKEYGKQRVSGCKGCQLCNAEECTLRNPGASLSVSRSLLGRASILGQTLVSQISNPDLAVQTDFVALNSSLPSTFTMIIMGYIY